jgi:hypothetical protein
MAMMITVFWEIMSCGLVVNVLEELAASIFRAEK